MAPAVSANLIVGTWGICKDKCRDWQSHTAEELGKGLRQGSALGASWVTWLPSRASLWPSGKQGAGPTDLRNPLPRLALVPSVWPPSHHGAGSGEPPGNWLCAAAGCGSFHPGGVFPGAQQAAPIFLQKVKLLSSPLGASGSTWGSLGSGRTSGGLSHGETQPINPLPPPPF